MTNRTGYFGTTRLRYSVVLAASVAFVAGCATATPTGQVAAVMGPARPVTAVPATRVPAGTTVPGAANCPMFPADNVWNTNISKLPVDKHSAAWLASMHSSTTYLHPDFGPNPGGYPYGIPFTIVTSKTRRVRIKFQYASESYRGLYPFGPSTPIEGGKNAGGDRHAIMVNKTTCTLYELWEAQYSPRGSTAGSGAMWHLTSDALRPAGWTSADAAGLPILPGLLDYAQVEAAVRTGKPITHAIRFTAEVTRSSYLWPARHEAGSGLSENLPPMGARFRLKASFSVAKFCRNSEKYCRDAKAVLVEMQNYGLILADNGSNWFFQGSAYPQWPDALVSLLKLIPARDFQAVDESCLMVSRNSGEARAKRGCPIG
ncbi:MAG TPA: hypothetical protein VK823_03775 [Streptosporangiaceae bacterium]|nr:hypothetical protein [Streptosporangiaceae bacterium]